MSKQETDALAAKLVEFYGAANGWQIAQSIIGLLIGDGLCTSPRIGRNKTDSRGARLSIQTTEALQDEEWRRYAESPLTS